MRHIIANTDDMSQCDVILKHLEANPDGITPLEAMNFYGIMRLGARIWALKADGHDIKTETVKRKRGKKTIKYARYVLREAS